MDWRQIPSLSALRAFEAAARTGSLSEAARELNVTHAAIAQHLRKLEEHVGRALMRREGRGMALTEDGRRLAQPLGQAFGQIADAMRAISDDPGRPLAVTLTPSFAAQWLMPRLGDFWAKHADVPLTLHPDRHIVDLARDGMDLAIRYGDGKWPNLQAEMLTPADFCVVAAPNLLDGRENFSLEELAAMPWVIEEDWPEQLAYMSRIGLDVSRIRTTMVPTEELALSAARQGYGLHVELGTLVADDLATGRLRSVHCAPVSGLGYYLVTRPGPVKANLRLFMRWLKSVV
jgi:LysR family glycine cleavage system transcriptional activator